MCERIIQENEVLVLQMKMILRMFVFVYDALLISPRLCIVAGYSIPKGKNFKFKYYLYTNSLIINCSKLSVYGFELIRA